jgi:hypothetical protein
MSLKTAIEADEGRLNVTRTQDCTPIAERTKALHNEGYHGSSDFKHAGSIPFIFFEDYCNRNNLLFSEVMTNKEHLRRILNDPALAHFRVWKGKI